MSFFTKRTVTFKLLFLVLLTAVTCYLVSCGEEKKLWRIAYDPLWSPMSLTGRERNMTGFSNDLMIAIVGAQSSRLELFSSPSAALYVSLDSGVYDGVLGGLTPDNRSREKYEFSEPFYLLGPVLVVASSSSITSFEDMQGKILGIMSDVNPVFDVTFYARIYLKTFQNTVTALESLKNNQIDGLIMFALPAYSNITALFPHNLKVVTPPLTQEGLRLIVRKSPLSQEFVALFNEGLSKLKKEGTYQQLLDKWGLINTAP